MSRRKKIFTILGVLLAILLLGGLLLLINFKALKTLYQEAIFAKITLLEAKDNVIKQNFKQATEKLIISQGHFSQAQEATKKIKVIKYIPLVRRQFKAADALLETGHNLTGALAKLTALAEEIFSPLKSDGQLSFSKLTSEQKQEILKKIYESPPDLQGAKAEIDLAYLAASRIPATGLVGPLKRASEPVKSTLNELKTIIDSAVPAAEALPIILGYPKEKTYLFLLQNNAELRPTGGFIGTYGILKVKNGDIIHFKTDNIYNLDNKVEDILFVEKPDPLKKYINTKPWYMRDCNWSPDFPTSAQKCEEFFNLEKGGETLDGTLAVTPEFIQSLLQLTGPIKVAEIEFTADNLTDTLQYQVEQGYLRQGISDAERKEIIGKLSQKILENILALPQTKWPDLWKTFLHDVQEKNILLYLHDQELQSQAQKLGWTGEIKQVSNDFLMVVDANMAALKTDQKMKKTISYQVRQEGDGLIADLNIYYKHEGSFDWKTTRYRTYTRVYVPKGSQLLESSGIMENDKLSGGRSAEPIIYEELGKTVFAGFIAIEPQTEETLHYKYKLPFNSEGYKLYVQKQPGTNSSFILDLDIPGKKAQDNTTLNIDKDY